MWRKWSPHRKRSSAFLLACIAPLVASAQLAIGVEQPVSAPDMETLARTGTVAIASNGVTMLAVWTDRRTDRGVEMVAARLDSAARVLDPRGIALTATPEIDEELPFVEFDGVASFVVVWFAEGNTMAAKVNDKGVILAGPVVLAEGRPEGLALNNRDLAVAIGDATGTTISIVRSDLMLRTLTRVARVPDVEITAIGNGFAVVWFEKEFSSGQLIVRAMRIDRRTGAIAAQTLTQLGKFEAGATMAVGTHDDDAIIAAGSNERMVVARLAADGVVTMITTTTAVLPRVMEEVVARANGFDVVARIDGRPHVFRYVADALAGENEPINAAASDGAGAFAERVFTIWNIGGVLTGRFAFVTEQEPPIVISRSPASQQQPVLATDGELVLAAWTEDVTDTGERIMFRLLGLDGRPDAAMARPLSIATRTMTPMQSPPAMAFVSNNYFITWTDQRSGADKPAHVLMRNVNRRGVLGGTQQLSTLANPAERTAIAAGPTDALVLWIEGVGAARELRGSFVSAPLTAFGHLDIAGEPAAVHGENGWVAVGTTRRLGVRGIFVAADRTTRFLFDTSPPFGFTDSDPSVAWSPRAGGKYLVVFRRGDAVFARLLGRDGTPDTEPFALTTEGFNDNPRVVWDGHAFVITWTSRTSTDPLSHGDLHTMRLLVDGTGQPQVTVSATPLNDDHGWPLALGDGTLLVGYQRMVTELMNVHRVFTRVVVGPAIPIPPAPLGKRRSVRQ